MKFQIFTFLCINLQWTMSFQVPVVEYRWLILDAFNISMSVGDAEKYCGKYPSPLAELTQRHSEALKSYHSDVEKIMDSYGLAFRYFRSVRGSGVKWKWEWRVFNTSFHSMCTETRRQSFQTRVPFEIYADGCEGGFGDERVEWYLSSASPFPVSQYEWSSMEVFKILMDEKDANIFCGNNPTQFMDFERDHTRAVAQFFDQLNAAFRNVGSGKSSLRPRDGIEWDWNISNRSSTWFKICNQQNSSTSDGAPVSLPDPISMFNPLTDCNPHFTAPCIGTACSGQRPRPPRVNGGAQPQSNDTPEPHGRLLEGNNKNRPRRKDKIVKRKFVVSYISGAPDGVPTPRVLGINGKYPCPTIEATEGDILQIEVINRIQDGQNTSIHWHGLHQAGTPFEDGPVQIMQCPIINGGRQVYKFPLKQHGTYWYHSHVKSQYTEGLWGLLIIRPRKEIYKFDDEITVTLTEWYHQTADQNEKKIDSEGEGGGIPPYPDSVLMNGIGRYNCTLSRSKNRICNPNRQLRPVFHLKDNKVYKLRLVNAGGWGSFNFTIDHHSLEVVEVDGIDVKGGVIRNAVHISPGQRYAFILRRESNQESRFLMRAFFRREFMYSQDTVNINPFPSAIKHRLTGILQYSTQSSNSSNLGKNPAREIFNFNQESSFRLLSTMQFFRDMDFLPHNRTLVAPSNFDVEFVVDISFITDKHGHRKGTFNNIPFKMPHGKPLLARMLEGSEFPKDILSLHVDYGKVVQIVVNNPYPSPHPIHLHGHHFFVVGMGRMQDGFYNKKIHNLTMHAPLRDTAMVNERSYLVIRFIADNPGLWTMHCHIDWHNLSGMLLTIVEAQDIARRTIQIPDEARRVCRDHGVEL